MDPVMAGTAVYTIMLVTGLCVGAIGTVHVTVAVALGINLLMCNILKILQKIF
jgi:hypothetical protein